ncbi:hypothetical protein CEP54_009803 [Fusarium duplospermum]|uniref:Peptidase C14 caspase domain-containing protein n=1 Tax=Fusarium duplospermum TaxID=1325734 RepID=A0A428PNF7_9HYPO|nr:hypothetical protein CEP54_009803 [Fusarium duplospermum]
MPKKKYALLVGIDSYLNGSRTSSDGQQLLLRPLRGCVKDVKDMKNFLENYSFDEITSLTSPNLNPEEPTELSPTFSNIRTSFDSIRSQVERGDTFFFHYSGHGAQLPRVRESPADRLKDPSLLTMDFCDGQPALRGWQLNQWLQDLHTKGVHIVVSLDSCYSGGAWRDDNTTYRTPQDWPNDIGNLPADEAAAAAADPEHPDSPYRDARVEPCWSINPENFTLLTACDVLERAAETTVDGESMGAFTNALLTYVRGGASTTTYRMIRNHLSGKLGCQTPKIYGHDRQIFLRTSEPLSVTRLSIQIRDGQILVPVGKAHGVHQGSEFMLSQKNMIVSIQKANDFDSIAEGPSGLADQQHHMAIPSRWNFGEKPFQVLVDPAFGPAFRTFLRESLNNRISGVVDVIPNSEDHQGTDLLRLEKEGDEVKILGPRSLIGYDVPVRPLRIRGNDAATLAEESAAPLAHLGRFRSVLNDPREMLSSLQQPFEVKWTPENVTVPTASYPTNQKFLFEFTSKSSDELYVALILFSPEFKIRQVYPSDDSSRPVRPGSDFDVTVTMCLPKAPGSVEDTLHYSGRRDILRTIVTRGKQVSWASLELPPIWEAKEIKVAQDKGFDRDGEATENVRLWINDKEIITG